MEDVSRKTFENANTETKLNILFDCICSIDSKLTKHKLKTSFFAAVGGIVGGIITVVSKFMFWGGK